MDIKDLYVKIPINHTLSITNKLLKNNQVDKYITKDIMSILKMIKNQNYFQYEGKYYKPTTGVAMGSPLSGILAEIFLQDLEQNRVKYILEDKKIVYYNRYVDDIFIIYDQRKITPQTILENFNIQHKDLNFTTNTEINNQINYLDLNLTNKQGQINMEIFRKPTTDVMIANSSCHPHEHKLAAIKNWIHRLNTLPLNENSKRKELNTIINIALNNGYRENDILSLYNRTKHKQTNRQTNTEENKKWITFTYTGNYIRKITNLFKDTNLKIAFRTTNTITKILSNNYVTNTCEQSGIYNITCQSCHKVYVGQTGRNNN
jgi:hypothetical protein